MDFAHNVIVDTSDEEDGDNSKIAVLLDIYFLANLSFVSLNPSSFNLFAYPAHSIPRGRIYLIWGWQASKDLFLSLYQPAKGSNMDWRDL